MKKYLKCKKTGIVFKIEKKSDQWILTKRRGTKNGFDWWVQLITVSEDKALTYLKNSWYDIEEINFEES